MAVLSSLAGSVQLASAVDFQDGSPPLADSDTDTATAEHAGMVASQIPGLTGGPTALGDAQLVGSTSSIILDLHASVSAELSAGPADAQASFAANTSPLTFQIAPSDSEAAGSPVMLVITGLGDVAATASGTASTTNLANSLDVAVGVNHVLINPDDNQLQTRTVLAHIGDTITLSAQQSATAQATFGPSSTGTSTAQATASAHYTVELKSIDLSTSILNSDGTANLYFSIDDAGGYLAQAAIAPTAAAFWAKGVTLGDQLSVAANFPGAVPAGPVDSEVSQQISYTGAPSQATHLIFAADPSNAVGETLESNNLQTQRIVPDLLRFGASYDALSQQVDVRKLQLEYSQESDSHLAVHLAFYAQPAKPGTNRVRLAFGIDLNGSSTPPAGASLRSQSFDQALKPGPHSLLIDPAGTDLQTALQNSGLAYIEAVLERSGLALQRIPFGGMYQAAEQLQNMGGNLVVVPQTAVIRAVAGSSDTVALQPGINGIDVTFNLLVNAPDHATFPSASRFLMVLGDRDDTVTVTGAMNVPMTVMAGAGDDAIQGGGGGDRLFGEGGVDDLHGALGDDLLAGGSGTDVLDGGPGVNRVYQGEQYAALVTAAGATVRVFEPESLSQRFEMQPYGNFGGGVRIATGDINGDGAADIITAAGPGGGPHVRVFDGITGQPLAGPLGSFFAYVPTFTSGLFVASGDVNGDGRDDLVTAAGAGGGPHVKVYSGLDGAVLWEFFSYDATFAGGVTVAVGDVNGDGKADIITGTGPGGGPHLKVFNAATHTELYSFFAYAPTFTGGLWVAAGDVNGDHKADIFIGAGAGGGPHVRVLNGANLAELHSFFAYAPTFTGGIRVAAGDVDGDGRDDIITGAGPGGGPHVRAINGINGMGLASFFAYEPSFTGGIFVAGTPAISGPAALRLAGPPGISIGGEGLTNEQLAALRTAAIERWQQAGLPEEQLQQLQNLRIAVADLPDDLLGLASVGEIRLDRDAAGRGWFMDDTLGDDDEFSIHALASPATADHIDLLTVVLHEFGHQLGLGHQDSASADALMQDDLGPGLRRLPTRTIVDRLFAAW